MLSRLSFACCHWTGPEWPEPWSPPPSPSIPDPDSPWTPYLDVAGPVLGRRSYSPQIEIGRHPQLEPVSFFLLLFIFLLTSCHSFNHSRNTLTSSSPRSRHTP